MKRLLLLALFVIVCKILLIASNPKPTASVPFEMVGSYVVVHVKINNSSTLHLILDSGIRNTIITELQADDHVTLNYASVKEMMGLGGGDHLEAYTSNFNSIKVGKIILDNKAVFVLKEDVFNLSKQTGAKINGLIGLDFFHNRMVEINYSTKRVNFYENGSFNAFQGYEKLPLEIENQKLFVRIDISETNKAIKSVKMLIDTGAELNAWFQTFKPNSVHIPANAIHASIGSGLNGEIIGKIARFDKLWLGTQCISSPIVSFPDSASISEIIAKSDRDGTIGSQLLRRFDYMIDMDQKTFYFKPNSHFKTPFYYNIAGIELVKIVPFLPQTEVWKVWEGSPAANAGIRVGDQLVELNGKKASQLTINEIKFVFQTPSNQPLNLTVVRADTLIELKLNMKSRI